MVEYFYLEFNTRHLSIWYSNAFELQELSISQLCHFPCFCTLTYTSFIVTILLVPRQTVTVHARGSLPTIHFTTMWAFSTIISSTWWTNFIKMLSLIWLIMTVIHTITNTCDVHTLIASQTLPFIIGTSTFSWNKILLVIKSNISSFEWSFVGTKKDDFLNWSYLLIELKHAVYQRIFFVVFTTLHDFQCHVPTTSNYSQTYHTRVELRQIHPHNHDHRRTNTM